MSLRAGLLAASLGALAAACAGARHAPVATPDAPFRYQRPALAPLPPAAVGGVQTATLANGLRLIVAEDPAATSVRVVFVNRRGGDDTERDRAGLAAVTARAMASAVGRCESEGATACENGPTHYGVDHHSAHFSGQVAPGAVGVFIRRVAAGLRGGVTLEHFAPALLGTLTSVAESASDPGLGDFIPRAVFADGSLFQSDVRGRVADLRALDLERASDFFSRRYAPSECALIAAGRVTLGEVQAYAERLLGPWRAAAPPPAPTPRAALREGGDRLMLLETGNRPQASIVVAVPVRTEAANARAAVRVLADVLASSSWSRLPRALRFERGSAYSVNAEVSEYGDVSLLEVSTAVETGRAVEALRLIRGALEDVARAGVSDEEFERARRSTAVEWRALSETTVGRASVLYAAFRARSEDPAAPPPWVPALDTLTRAEVNRVLAAELSASRARYFIEGDPTPLREGLATLGLGRVATLRGE